MGGGSAESTEAVRLAVMAWAPRSVMVLSRRQDHPRGEGECSTEKGPEKEHGRDDAAQPPRTDSTLRITAEPTAAAKMPAIAAANPAGTASPRDPPLAPQAAPARPPTSGHHRRDRAGPRLERARRSCSDGKPAGEQDEEPESDHHRHGPGQSPPQRLARHPLAQRLAPGERVERDRARVEIRDGTRGRRPLEPDLDPPAPAVALDRPRRPAKPRRRRRADRSRRAGRSGRSSGNRLAENSSGMRMRLLPAGSTRARDWSRR